MAQTLLRLASDTTAHRPPDARRLGMVVAHLVTAMFAHTLRADSGYHASSTVWIRADGVRGPAMEPWPASGLRVVG
ncbi:hypothetical protein [Embleya sp. NPDC020630]|uniref:hypothetical protein n=1 Tax=Embleya sp. NPDC020630 TaxID=3363979 RepID=UPI003787EFB3